MRFFRVEETIPTKAAAATDGKQGNFPQAAQGCAGSYYGPRGPCRRLPGETAAPLARHASRSDPLLCCCAQKIHNTGMKGNAYNKWFTPHRCFLLLLLLLLVAAATTGGMFPC